MITAGGKAVAQEGNAVGGLCCYLSISKVAVHQELRVEAFKGSMQVLTSQSEYFFKTNKFNTHFTLIQHY